MTKIIAFAGKKGSGKDTAGNFLLNNAKEFWGSATTIRKYHWADKLKEFCRDFLKVPSELMWGMEEDKNKRIDHILWENMPHYASIPEVLSGIEYIDGPTLQTVKTYTKLVGPMSVREILQQVGTEWFRKLRKNIWVEMCLEQIQKDSPDFAVICDTRFPNEVDAVLNSGGLCIYLTRNIGESNHTSETSLDPKNYDWSNFDLIIHNDKMSVVETQKYIVSWLESREGK